jgi:hypothetical protein
MSKLPYKVAPVSAELKAGNWQLTTLYFGSQLMAVRRMLVYVELSCN